jgi:hypothetical protein
MPPPVALRELIMQSDRIVVATLSGSAVEKVVREDDDSKSVSMRTSFGVSETLKGKPEPIIHVYTYRYISKDKDATEIEQDRFAKDKTLLLFLNKRDAREGDGYTIADYREGVKELSDEALNIYTDRINEFVEIMKDQKPDKNKIVEWLVRLAEEPATRWEGAYDLNRNFDIMRYEDVQKAEKEKNKNSSDENNDADDVEETNDEVISETRITLLPIRGRNVDSYDAELARLVSRAQKERLANALFNTETLSRGDTQLISLVKNWEGKKVAAFLLPHLRKVEKDNQGNAYYYMEVIADILGDDELTKISEAFYEIAWSDDEEIVEAAELEAKMQEQEDVEETDETETENSDDEEKTDDEEKPKTEKQGPTVSQMRSQLLERFITRCESVLAQE